MAATNKVILFSRPNFRSLLHRRPYPFHFYSSSSVPDSTNTSAQSDSESDSKTPNQSPFSSYFSDVKSSLQREPPPENRPQFPRKPLSFSNSTPQTRPSNIDSLEEIRKNLAEFRRRSNVPPPPSSPAPRPSHSGQHISFQELYKRNVISKSEDSVSSSHDVTARLAGHAAAGGRLSFEAIRESLRQLRSTAPNRQADSGGQAYDSMSLARLKESLNLRPVDLNEQEPQRIIGGSDNLPASIFGKEKKEIGDGVATATRTEFVKMYSYNELGEKLKMLRPEKKKGKWFSLQELNERLVKLREIEEKESEARIGGVTFKDLRESLVRLKISDDEKARKYTMQRLDVLGQLGGTPSFMLSPPKEHLVERYFHPDNLSSAEKLTLELKKVRDEFKMSESDCGSACVQVAQLTTKIKHKSSILLKKDKHSRRGLLAMVQRRKKLLKYLRRTDWDSYSLVLSKLGLRDNPDYKA